MTALLFALSVKFDNNLSLMHGSVDAQTSGLSLATGVPLELEGTDLDDQDTASRMMHVGSANTQPDDTSAPGTLQTWDYVGSNPSIGYKHWEGLYTLIEVPEDTTYYKTFKGTLVDQESEFSTWKDPSVLYTKSIAISGPHHSGGGGG